MTPNSFSDGGKYDHYQEFSLQLNRFLKCFDVIDIGAESTAPMNKTIEANVEWQRLESTLVKFVETEKNIPAILSLDTFKVETIVKVADWLHSKNDWSGELWWNDVSGKFDQDVISFLKNYPRARYVFCHNLSPERKLSGEHMKYVHADGQVNLVDSLVDYFGPYQGLERVIFDPCFGFSKTKDQNISLWKSLPELLSRLSKQNDWVLGISRKSMLRFQSEEIDKDNLLFETELLQVLLLEQFLQKKLNKNIIVRAHRPEIFRALNFFHQHF